MAAMLRLFVSPRLEEHARSHAQEADSGHQHHMAGEESMTLAGADPLGVGMVRRRPQLPRRLADAVEGDHDRVPARRVHRPARRRLLQRPLHHRRPAVVTAVENVIVGPIIAVLSFVCSVGNIPLAAVLWSGGISFAGVMAFIFADLIVLPIIAAYRKYYGTDVRPADHGADVRDDGDRGADRRRPLQRPRADPRCPPDPERDLQLDPARLQAGPQRPRPRHLRRALLPDQRAAGSPIRSAG